MGSPSGVNSSFLSRLPEEDKQAIKAGQQARWTAAVDANDRGASERGESQQRSPARLPTDAAYAGASPTSSGRTPPGNTTSSSPSVVTYNTTEPHPNFPGSHSPLDIINPPLLSDGGSGGENPSLPISVFNPSTSGAPSSAEPTPRSQTDADVPPARPTQPDSFVDRQRDIDLFGTGNYSVSRAMQSELDADIEGARERVAKLEGQLQNLPTGPFSHIVRAELEDELTGLESQLRDYDLPGDAADGDASIEAELEEDQGSLLTPFEERPPLPAAVAAEEQGQQHFINGREGTETTVIVNPPGGGYYRHEYIWDEESGGWIESAYEWGGPGGGTLGRHDFIDPENDFRIRPEEPDTSTPYERMQEHYDPEGNNLNSYPNTIYPGMFPDGPIGPNYDNYPEVDAVPDVITDFGGVPTNTNPATGAGIGYALADAAILGVSPATFALPLAFTALDLADKYDGAPTLEGPAPQRMEGTGLPRTDIDYSR